jgi:transposase
VLVARRDQLETELEKLAASAPCSPAIARLRCLREISTLSAVGLCAEIGEWDRFDHPDQLSAYLGIVPCQHTTGQQRRQGSITKAGSPHARRLLIKAAYHYRRQPGVGRALEERQRDQPPQIINIAWRAQRRLNARWRQLKDARHKPNGIVAVSNRPRTRRLLLGDRPHRVTRSSTQQPVAADEAPRASRPRAQQSAICT